MDHEFALEVLGEPACVASDGLEQPISLRLGEERCVFRVLEIKMGVREFAQTKTVERLTSCIQK